MVIAAARRRWRWLAIAAGVAVVAAGCTGMPSPPSMPPAPSVSVPAPTPGDHTIVVRTSTDVAATIRWVAGDYVEERFVEAGEGFGLTTYAAEPYLVVVTVAGDGPGSVTCSTSVDNGPFRTSAASSSSDELAPVAVCHTGAPRLPDDYEPSPAKAHQVTFRATTTGEMVPLWLTENGVSSMHRAGQSSAIDQVNHGPAILAVVNVHGSSSCHLDMASGTLVSGPHNKPGEIALCSAQFPYPSPGG